MDKVQNELISWWITFGKDMDAAGMFLDCYRMFELYKRYNAQKLWDMTFVADNKCVLYKGTMFPIWRELKPGMIEKSTVCLLLACYKKLPGELVRLLIYYLIPANTRYF